MDKCYPAYITYTCNMVVMIDLTVGHGSNFKGGGNAGRKARERKTKKVCM